MAATQLALSRPARKQVARPATVALVGLAYFVVVIVALHVLRPDHNPIRLVTSYYAVGPYGWLMSSAFVSMSVALLALVRGLYHGVAQPARSRLGLGLLGVWGVGLLIAMTFPLNPEGTPPTLSGIIHRINGPVVFLSLTAGMILVSRRIKYDDRWRPVHRPALILSLVMLALVMVTLLNNVTGWGVAGLVQRLSLVTTVTWFMLTAMRLRSIAPGVFRRDKQGTG